MKGFRILCLIALVLAIGVSAYGAEKSGHPLGLHPNNPYGRLTMEYVTPHVKWANPYYQGETKVLVLAPTWSQRETVELAERLSIDYTAWMSLTYFKGAEAPADSIARFFSGPQNLVHELLDTYCSEKSTYDAIIVGKLNWEMLPAENRFQLLKKVADGAGLVYVNPPVVGEELGAVLGKKPASDNGFITMGIPLKALPRFARSNADEVVKTSGFGKGRVVQLIYDEPKTTPVARASGITLHSLTPSWPLAGGVGGVPKDEEPPIETFYYDYYQGLLAKAVLWAAGREPGITLEDFGAYRGSDKVAAVNWGLAPEEKLSVKLARSEGPSEVAVELAVRNTYGETLARDEKKVRFSEGGAAADFGMVALSAGEYFADFRVLTGGKVINWGSLPFTVISKDVDVPDITVQAVEIEEPFIGAGDDLPVKVTFSRALAAGEGVRVELWDNLGRLMEKKEMSASGSETSVSFGPIEPLTIMHEVRARIVRGERPVHELRKPFPVRLPNRCDDFSSILWADAKNEYVTHMMFRKLREDEGDAIDMSHTGCLFRGGPTRPPDQVPIEVDLKTSARIVAMADLMLLPYNARFGVLGGNENHVATPYCMSDPEKFEEFEACFATDEEVFGPYGPIGYTHGDESYLSNNPDVCRSPSCLAGFRDYLKREYGSLEALNASWQSDWKSWDEVLPSTFEEVKESGNYPPWFDHKVYMSTVFADFYKNIGDVLRRRDSSVRTGFDGALGFSYPNSALDWWKLSKAIQVFQTYNTYYDSQMEIWRSFAPPESLRGMWFGSYGVWGSMPSIPEFSHYHIWHSLFQGLNSSWFWTMGRPGAYCSGYAPDLTSLPYFEARTEALREVKAGIGKLLLSCKRQNDGVAIHWSQGSLIAESLFAEKPQDWSRAVVNSQMYFSRLLEALNLQYEFVSYEEVENDILQKEQYRLLILPHSRVISEKEAEKIEQFVKAGGVLIADITPGGLDEHCNPRTKNKITVVPFQLFPSDKEGTVTKFGAGRAVLLGDRGTVTDRSWKALRPHAEALKDILTQQAGIKPVVSAGPRDKNNPDIPPVEIARFGDGGGIEYAGVLRFYYYNDTDFSAYPFEVKFDRKGHIYDVRAQKYLGFKDEVTRDISYTAHLLAMSPYRVKELNVTVPSEKVQPGEALKVSASLSAYEEAKVSTHAFRLRVFGPDKKELRHYARNLIAKGGRCETSIRFAVNDVPGAYELSVQDVMSGVEGRATISLQK
jgi:hypothetical protein